jgi:hypothetical protein
VWRAEQLGMDVCTVVVRGVGGARVAWQQL